MQKRSEPFDRSQKKVRQAHGFSLQLSRMLWAFRASVSVERTFAWIKHFAVVLTAAPFYGTTS